MKFILTLFVTVLLSLLTKFNCNETVEYKVEKLTTNLANLETENKIEESEAKVNSEINKKSEVNKAEAVKSETDNSVTAKTEKNPDYNNPKMKTKKELTNKPLTPTNMHLTLPETEIYFQGWARYYHYSIMSKERIRKPRLFFQNDHFFAQRIRKPKQTLTDQYGSMAIPNKAAFFMILYNKTLSVFSSREDTLLRQVDMLSMKYIDLIPEDDINKGSVRFMGDFPTGSCIEVKAKIPLQIGGAKITHYWNICFDNIKQQVKFKKMLIKLKLRQQRADSMIPITTDRNKHPNALSNAFKLGKTPMDPSKKSPKNGYWMLLQDWTDCTLSCGGGWHYQQWLCIPPKFGGIDCIGDAIRRKRCNTQPCPHAKDMLEGTKAGRNGLPVTKSPSIKVGRFSARPQRYSKCLIKENDAYLTEFDIVTKKVTKKIPVRVVMNNRTISVFQDDDYSDMLKTFKLRSTSFLHSEKFCCFGIRDNEKEIRLCGYPENCGELGKPNDWSKKWQDDFVLFKVQCRVGMEETMLTPEDLNRLNNTELMDPLGIDIDAVKRRKKQLKDEMINENEKSYKHNILQTQELGFKAIEREFNIENMIKKEEKAKEDIEVMDIEDRIKKEEKKANCIHKDIEEKDLDDDWDDKIEAEEEMDRLKKKINIKIESGRNRVKQLLAKMRKKARLRKQELLQKLQAVRAKMASDILLENKEGKIPPCIKGKTDADFRESYCNLNFVEDYVTNSGCKDSEDFCYTCCEHEFGNMFRMKRAVCYKACDGADKKNGKINKNGKPTGKQGEWVWAPEHQTKG